MPVDVEAGSREKSIFWRRTPANVSDTFAPSKRRRPVSIPQRGVETQRDPVLVAQGAFRQPPFALIQA